MQLTEGYYFVKHFYIAISRFHISWGSTPDDTPVTFRVHLQPNTHPHRLQPSYWKSVSTEYEQTALRTSLKKLGQWRFLVKRPQMFIESLFVPVHSSSSHVYPQP